MAYSKMSKSRVSVKTGLVTLHEVVYIELSPNLYLSTVC